MSQGWHCVLLASLRVPQGFPPRMFSLASWDALKHFRVCVAGESLLGPAEEPTTDAGRPHLGAVPLVMEPATSPSGPPGKDLRECVWSLSGSGKHSCIFLLHKLWV